jgi:hypothetical protein
MTEPLAKGLRDFYPKGKFHSVCLIELVILEPSLCDRATNNQPDRQRPVWLIVGHHLYYGLISGQILVITPHFPIVR